MIIIAVTKTVNYETKFKHLPLTPILVPPSQQGFLPLQHDHSSIMTYWTVGTETQKPENVISIHNEVIKSPN
jgi:hypothetical protein